MSAEGTLVPELRRALAHLDDPLFLETLPLTDMLVHSGGDVPAARGALLRRLLLEAIDALAPERNYASGDVRSYDILYRYAISKESMTAIAQQLGLSERHAYRELHQAVDALALVVQRLSEEAFQPTEEDQPEAPSEDLARLLEVGPQHIDLVGLVGDTVSAVGALASQRGVRLTFNPVGSPLAATVHRTLLRQALVSLLSHAIRSGVPGDEVYVRLSEEEGAAVVRVRFRVQTSAMVEDGPYAVAQRVLDLMDLAWSEERVANGDQMSMRILVPLKGELTVAIIDDNADLIALFRRYLRGAPYRVIGFDQVEEGLAALDSLQPDVLILDIAMPHLDGWEVLQSLAAAEREHRPRIVVCSIINDPHLAAALGADAFLNKPVSRSQLLSTLEEVLDGPA